MLRGESGPKAEPADPDWFRKVRDDCKVTGVPFFFKQWGTWHPLNGSNVKAGEKISVRRWPEDREPMYRAKDKSFNLLDDEVIQQFPEPKKSVTFT